MAKKVLASKVCRKSRCVIIARDMESQPCSWADSIIHGIVQRIRAG